MRGQDRDGGGLDGSRDAVSGEPILLRFPCFSLFHLRPEPTGAARQAPLGAENTLKGLTLSVPLDDGHSLASMAVEGWCGRVLRPYGAGGFVWPDSSLPQQATVPLVLTPQAKPKPELTDEKDPASGVA